MLDKLSDLSKRCFNAAKAQAFKMKSKDLTAFHLILGLLQESAETFKEFLANSSATIESIAKLAQEKAGAGAQQKEPQKLVVTDAVKDALRQANDALSSPDKLIEPQDILLALLSASPEIGELFNQAGIPKEQLIEAIKNKKQQEITAKEQAAKEQPVAANAVATPTLDTYGRDLTALARAGKLTPVLGREMVILGMMEILCRRTKNNPMLLGEAGVGKTAIVEGFAQKVADGDVPDLLKGFRVVELTMSALTAGASTLGMFEERMRGIASEIVKAGNIILFIDEAHSIIGAGGYAGLGDAATILKPMLARGELHCIGATTYEDFRRYIEKDEALARRFQTIRVEEPPKEVTMAILRDITPRLEQRMGVTIPDDLHEEIYDLCLRYLKNRYFPDKAIDLLERASARTMLTVKGERKTVELSEVKEVLTEITGLPLSGLSCDDPNWTEQLIEFLNSRVVGQNEVISALARTICLAKRRLDINPDRPDGVFLLVGPPDSGRYELAEALAEYLFGEAERLIDLDMSEFTEDHTIARLIGSPPGYIGYEEEGQLTGKVANRPFTVILITNVDMAARTVQNLFTQISDDGRLTDGQGRTVYFSDATLLLTVTMETEVKGSVLGFGGIKSETDAAQAELERRLKERVPQQLIDSMDEVFFFRDRSAEEKRQAARLEFENILVERLSKEGIKLLVDNKVYDFIMKKGNTEGELGRRSIARIVEKNILMPLSEKIGPTSPNNPVEVEVTVKNGEIQISLAKKA
jgi:ATP-dependent Clp protease ATP-binding subunit ClpC